MLYFQFLKAEDPALLKECSRIMNKMCFPHRSLHPYVKKIFASSDQTSERQEAYAMAKWFIAHKETDRAVSQLEAPQGKAFEDSDRALLTLAMLYKNKTAGKTPCPFGRN